MPYAVEDAPRVEHVSLQISNNWFKEFITMQFPPIANPDMGGTEATELPSIPPEEHGEQYLHAPDSPCVPKHAVTVLGRHDPRPIGPIQRVMGVQQPAVPQSPVISGAKQPPIP
jgi:hypothetical protein